MIALILAVLAVLALIILLSPVTISFNSVRSGGTIDGRLGVSWIIFLFSYALKEKQLEIQILGKRLLSHISKKPQEPEHKIERKKSGKMPPVRDLLNMTGPLLRLFGDMIRAIKLKYFDIDITFGLGDPEYTGILNGLMHAVGGSFRKGQNIRFAPDFTGTVLDWNLRAKASVTPIMIIMPFIKFVTNGKVLRFALQNLT